MNLRQLKMKDAKLMLEWMHDDNVVHDLHTDFASKSIDDCENFINANKDISGDSLNFAIASDEDEYMGTVSLKHIDRQLGTAEFAITIRKKAMSRGYAWFGMREIIEYAFNNLNLNSIYWCVSRNNNRAIRFYDKHNFSETFDIPLYIRRRYDNENELKWYSVLKGDTIEEKSDVVGCKVIHIKTIPTIEAGELSFFEGVNDLPFDIKRIYYISKVPEGIRRGYHAHKNLKQLLFCPYGRIQLVLENELGREEIELSDPSIGVLIDRPTWREMLWLQRDSVLCVAASEYYEVDDYIRDYDDFIKYLKNDN